MSLTQMKQTSFPMSGTQKIMLLFKRFITLIY